MKGIGEKETFWQIINGEAAKNILIPAIQRDYTYGAETEHTDKVLNNMLDNIERALYQPDEAEMTMNFVYGYTEEDVNYVPLDGQQRLTTLFLLHYYAALYSDSADFSSLRKFTYATRETTKSYCNQLIDRHSDILNSRKNTKTINEAIADGSWYLPNFKYDPSIKSMQVVLQRIEEKFAVHKEDLWEKLTADDCPVNFYKLDFGAFGLSDDLYVKMNSRGKKLTSYEIFKSMFLKHVEKQLGEKEYKRKLANKFDNGWTDLVWESIGKPQEPKRLSEIDDAYVELIWLMFRILRIRQNKMDKKISLDSKSITEYIGSKEDVTFIEDFLDVFVWVITEKKYGNVSKGVDMLTSGLKQIIKEKNPFVVCLKSGRDKIKNGDILMLLGQYWAFKNIKESVYDEIRAQLNFRHLRNIIENSDDEIRKEKMPSLLSEVESIMNCKLAVDAKVEFNTNQWKEECEKENHLDEWKRIWEYEEHPLLRGSVSNFAEKQTLNLSNADSVNMLIDRLDKFMCIFDKEDYSDAKRDHLIRAALLCDGDYSQIFKEYNEYRILGNIPLCWRNMLVKSKYRNNQDEIMKIIDSYEVSSSIQEEMKNRIHNFLNDPATNKLDWRYYVVKYREHTYKAYTHTDGYGYFWVPQNHTNSLGYANSLSVAVLQSTQFGASNVAWYLLNLIIIERNESKYKLGLLGTHAANGDERFIDLNTTRGHIYMTITKDGWYLKGITIDDATALGIQNVKDNNQGGIVVTPDANEDYIEWCEERILKQLF